MATHFIVNDSGLLIGVYEGDFVPSNSTTVPPLAGREDTPQRFVNGTWSYVTNSLKPTPPAFMLLFTLEERIRMRTERSTNVYVEDLLQTVEDPRLDVVDIISMGESIQALGRGENPILTADRIERILAGQAPLSAQQ